MKRRFYVLIFFAFFFYTTLTIFSSGVTFPLIAPTNPVGNLKFYDYAGVTHSHSIQSTGSGTIEDMSRAASAAKCNFLIITDLNQTLPYDWSEGYRDDVLVMHANEYSYLGGHLLAYDLPEAKKIPGLGQAQIIFNDLLHQNPRPLKQGFLIAPHPFLAQHGWETLNHPGLSGMEILNLDSLWRHEISRNKLSVLWSFLILPFNPNLSYLRLFNEPTKELQVWDEILAKKPFIGMGGSDATANAIPMPEKSFKFPSYARSFRLMKNHVLLKSELTGSFEEDRKKIMGAIGRGNFYFSLDIIGDPSGFYFIGQQRRQESLPGSSLPRNQGPVKFIVDTGRDIELPHEIVLLRNGQIVAISNSSKLEYSTEQSGAYRAIVRVIPTLPLPDGKNWFTWIFTNAIRID